MTNFNLGELIRALKSLEDKHGSDTPVFVNVNQGEYIWRVGDDYAPDGGWEVVIN